MNAHDATLTDPVSHDDHVQGSPDAAVTVIEYGDYQCRYCAMAHPMVKQLQQQYGEDLRLVFRHFPLTGMHELAMPAAQVAEAVGLRGDFWAMHDWLYDNHDRWVAEGVPGLQQGLRELGVDETAIARAIESGEPAERVGRDMQSGQRSGVNSTPSFFVNGRLFEGDSRALGRQIEGALAGR
ncbi:MAG TPA: thioredoxin domain-containing protein [Frateuria sp.]|uniref:DsbA family protein n=1 Tax=Frateuria sp. TaxID=2211372 RepID=UPI002DEBD174|nr:thioredoxin domain-containing protein [Frateuria sp.]